MVILLYCTICLGNTLYLILCSSDTVSFIYVLLNTECQTSTTIINCARSTCFWNSSYTFIPCYTYILDCCATPTQRTVYLGNTLYVPYCYCVPLTPYVVETHYNTVCHTGTIIINSYCARSTYFWNSVK